MENVIDSTYAKIYQEDGLVIGIFKDIEINREAAISIVSDRKRMSNNKSVPIFVDVRGTKNFTKEARDYFGSDIGSEQLLATVLLVDSSLTSFFANFLIKVSFKKAKIPMRVFSDEKKGKVWLRTFL